VDEQADRLKKVVYSEISEGFIRKFAVVTAQSLI
jgi:hypothetical protein